MPLVRLQSDPRAREKPCLRCGYSLRHNIDARNCPECGLSVWISLNGDDSLALSNPLWLTRLAAAAMVAAVVHLAMAVIAIALLALTIQNGTYWLMLTSQFTHPSYFAVATAGMMLMAGVATGFLTIPEGRYPDRAHGFRLGLRILAGIHLIIAAWIGWRSLSGNVLLWYTPILLCLLIGVCTAWHFLSSLVKRIPHRRLKNVTWALGWITGLACIPLILSGGAMMVFYRIYAGFSGPTMMWVAFATLYPFAGGVTLLLIAREFQKAAREAQENWVSSS